MSKRYIVGHCQECDSEVFYCKGVGNISYADTTCHNCGGQIIIDLNDEVSYNDQLFMSNISNSHI